MKSRTTKNINSIGTKQEKLKQPAHTTQPDIITIQETKSYINVPDTKHIKQHTNYILGGLCTYIKLNITFTDLNISTNINIHNITHYAT